MQQREKILSSRGLDSFDVDGSLSLDHPIPKYAAADKPAVGLNGFLIISESKS